MTDARPDDGGAAPIDLAHEAEFALGGMQVRPASREVVIAGKSHSLQPRVMQVLVALARRRGEVVSRDDLVSSCWEGLNVSEDAINRCIGQLRRLSEQSGGAAFSLDTIPRVGYRLTVTEGAPLAPAREQTAQKQIVVSIAVLPFINMSSDPEQEYFSDGLTEELMNQLAQLKELRVTGRTSCFAFKGKSEDLRTIGQKLGVAHILEGSVRRAGTRLRITAQLIKCADDYHLWSQTYDRELDDVFAIQDDVAKAVTKALGVTLGVSASSPDYGGTKSFEAYDHFLKGRFLPGVYDAPDQFRARADHLRKAVAIDPGYALAWANLANLLAFRQNFGPIDEARSLDSERDKAANQAITLAPDLPVANVAEGWRQADSRKWLEAEAAFMRAVAHGPSRDPHSEGIVGAYLANTGRVHEGLEFRLKARDSDPLWIGWVGHVLGSYYSLGLWERFDTEYARSQDLVGDRSAVETMQLLRLLITKASAEAINAQFSKVLNWPNASTLRALSQVYASRDHALAILRHRVDGPPASLFEIAELAGIYADVDLAVEALRKAVPGARLAVIQNFWSPSLSLVRKDPRFKDLVRNVGLVEFWRSSGKWGDFARPVGDDDFECW